jgi:RNA polymerase sigma-70 factor (ECF subfamily)
MDLRDPQSFARAYAEHAPGAAQAAGAILGPAGRRAEVEDVVHDVFLRLWHHPEGFDPTRGPLGAYVRLLARSRALDLARRQQVAARAEDRLRPAAIAAEPAVASQAERRATERALIRALATLPQPQREAIWLAYWGDLTTSEIASRAGVPQGTVKGRIRLGLLRLRTELETSDVAAGFLAALSQLL